MLKPPNFGEAKLKGIKGECPDSRIATFLIWLVFPLRQQVVYKYRHWSVVHIHMHNLARHEVPMISFSGETPLSNRGLVQVIEFQI